jgi:hypothetical protein
MSKVTTLADGQITGAVSILIELVEAEETPAVVIITWPAKPTACHPRRFGEIAAAIVRLFATAATELTRVNARKRL